MQVLSGFCTDTVLPHGMKEIPAPSLAQGTGPAASCFEAELVGELTVDLIPPVVSAPQ